MKPVEVGEPFRVDMVAAKRVLRVDRSKLWRHRAGLIFEQFGGLIMIPLKIAGCILGTIAATWVWWKVTSSIAYYFCPLNMEGAAWLWMLEAVITVGASVTIAYNWSDIRSGTSRRMRTVRDGWNPDGLGHRIDRNRIP
jgi:hypothetical protein